MKPLLLKKHSVMSGRVASTGSGLCACTLGMKQDIKKKKKLSEVLSYRENCTPVALLIFTIIIFKM
jgi:hypothetical protein